MDNREYIELMTAYYLNGITDRIHPAMILRRYNKFGYIKSIAPEIKNREYDITPVLHFGKFNNVIERFCKTISEKLPHCNLAALIENFETLKIVENEQMQTRKRTIIQSGSYIGNKNILNLYLPNIRKAAANENWELELEDVMTHELLHMATTYKRGSIELCGFHQTIGKKMNIGRGLNEGYTELLNLRYFSNDNKRNTYPEQVFIAMGIEEIVGREKMESLYFNADLHGLVEELSKYASAREVELLIATIDKCHRNEIGNRKEYLKDAAQARVIIANIKNRNNENLYKEGKISKEEYEFQKFKNYCYIKGHNLVRHGDVFGLARGHSKNGRKITSNAYRIVINNFINNEISTREYTIEDAQNKNSDFVGMSYCLNEIEFRDKRDLSQIDNIEMIPRGYKLVMKDQTEIVSQYDVEGELDIMFSEQTEVSEEKLSSSKKSS